MQIQISTRHGQVSEATQERIRSKVERLPRFFERLTKIEVIIDLTRRDAPTVDLKVSAAQKDFVATSPPSELLTAIDTVVDKMEQQLRKHKEKVQGRHRTAGGKQVEGRDPSDSGSELAD